MRPILAVAIAATLLLASSATGATTTDYVARSFNQPAAGGLAVDKPLDEFVATSRARAVVLRAWRSQKAKAGQLAFLTPGTSCRYRLTYSVTTRLAPDGEPSAYVAQRLPSPGARYLLDSGERSGSAFRTIRRPSQTSVRLEALWAAVLTRRKDIAPSGQVVWSEIRVAASSRPGDECHSGTYRDYLGPAISDSLATARASLRFVRKAR